MRKSQERFAQRLHSLASHLTSREAVGCYPVYSFDCSTKPPLTTIAKTLVSWHLRSQGHCLAHSCVTFVFMCVPDKCKDLQCENLIFIYKDGVKHSKNWILFFKNQERELGQTQVLLYNGHRKTQQRYLIAVNSTNDGHVHPHQGKWPAPTNSNITSQCPSKCSMTHGVCWKNLFKLLMPQDNMPASCGRNVSVRPLTTVSPSPRNQSVPTAVSFDTWRPWSSRQNSEASEHLWWCLGGNSTVFRFNLNSLDVRTVMRLTKFTLNSVDVSRFAKPLWSSTLCEGY